MNISIIKKNKFWVIIGGIVIMLLVAYFMIANKHRVEKPKQIASIKKELDQLQMLQMKGTRTINKKWIDASQAKLDQIKTEQSEYRKSLQERDMNIEKIFRSDEGDTISDEALWKNEYIQRVDQIYNSLSENNIPVDVNSLPFHQWRGEIPTWEKIGPVQKKFWILEELVNIVLNEQLKISDLNGIAFKRSTFPPGESKSDLYTIIPFTINLRIRTGSILFLINELSKSDLRFQIETINVRNDSKDPPKQISNASDIMQSYEPWREDSPTADPVVNVIINAHVIDFKS